MSFDVILCQDINGGIGKNGAMAWNVPEEMAFFKKVTMWTQDPDKKNAVVMGRKTWESLPDRFRPLPGRYNGVLTRDSSNLPKLVKDGAAVASTSLDDCLDSLLRYNDIERVYIIGGADVYRQAFQHKALNLIHLSVLYKDYNCDTFLQLPQNLEQVASASHVAFVNYILRRAT